MNVKSILSIPSVYKFLMNIISKKDSRKFIVDNIVKPDLNSKILDLGCGPSEILNYYPQSVDYTGVDISTQYINSAVQTHDKRFKFICNDINTYDTQDRYNIVTCFGFLHHLNDEEALRTLRLAHKVLEPSGRLVCLDPCYIPNQNIIAKLIISNDRGSFVRKPEQYQNLIEKVFPKSNVCLYDNLLRIPYNHISITAVK